MDKKKKVKNKENPTRKPDKSGQPKPCIYLYDRETGEWKVMNPSGSIAYNCLIRDEWSWLD